MPHRELVSKAAVIIGAFLITGGVAFAGTFTVTNTNSSGAGSLADAISQANAIPGPHTINITATGTMNVTTPLVLTQSMTINGPVATSPAFTIDGGNSSRLIQGNERISGRGSRGRVSGHETVADVESPPGGNVDSAALDGVDHAVCEREVVEGHRPGGRRAAP